MCQTIGPFEGSHCRNRPCHRFIGDTKGPEMRLGLFKGDKVTLKDGDAFTLTAEACEGTAEKPM